MADMVLLPGATCAYALEIADSDEAAAAHAAGGASDAGELLKALSGLYVALDQCEEPAKGHLVRFHGTDFVQWLTPRKDGTRQAEGAIMKIVEVQPRKRS